MATHSLQQLGSQSRHHTLLTATVCEDQRVFITAQLDANGVRLRGRHRHRAGRHALGHAIDVDEAGSGVRQL
jgi:hypothetical protein